MKKIIFMFILVAAFAGISVIKLSAHNEKEGKYANPAIVKDSNGISKPELSGSKVEGETSSQVKATESLPGILFILSNDKGQVSWSPSLWWSYKHGEQGQPGC
jgi:hypothetical protein